MEWSAPDTPRGIITSYSITYYVTTIGNSSSNAVITSDGATTSKTISDLMKYTEYSVYVEAYTSVGVGDRSELVTVTTDEDGK